MDIFCFSMLFFIGVYFLVASYNATSVLIGITTLLISCGAFFAIYHFSHFLSCKMIF